MDDAAPDATRMNEGTAFACPRLPLLTCIVHLPHHRRRRVRAFTPRSAGQIVSGHALIPDFSPDHRQRPARDIGRRTGAIDAP